MAALEQEGSEQREIETKRIRDVMRESTRRESRPGGCRRVPRCNSLDEIDAVAQFAEDDE